MARSPSSVWDPIPHSFFTGRDSKTDATVSSPIQRRPSGFARSLASLATRMFGPMPTVQVMPSSLLTAALIARATFSGPPKRWCEPVMSRKTSSMEYVSKVRGEPAADLLRAPCRSGRTFRCCRSRR